MSVDQSKDNTFESSLLFSTLIRLHEKCCRGHFELSLINYLAQKCIGDPVYGIFYFMYRFVFFNHVKRTLSVIN